MTASPYDVDKDGNENRILFWLRLDTWHLCQAALLFIDVNPDSVEWHKNKNWYELTTLKGVAFAAYAFENNAEEDAKIVKDIEQYERKYNDMHRILFDQDMEFNTPDNWIERALAKNISIPWLDFAIEHGFYKSETTSAQVEKPIFDKASLTYPVELDLAMQAWQAVTSNLGKGKPKSQIRAWLDANTKLANEAKERISIVANWDKTGGAARTD